MPTINPDALFYARNREEWRAWLEENHAKAREVWLVYYKKHSSEPRVPYDEAVEEALCFGWIDSTVKTLDEDRYVQRFTPRTNNANWSASNRERLKRLLAAGRMTPAGLATLPPPDSAPPERLTADSPLPPLFAEALAASPAASAAFEALPPGARKDYVRWVSEAKKEETRQRRAAEAIRLLAAGQRLGLK